MFHTGDEYDDVVGSALPYSSAMYDDDMVMPQSYGSMMYSSQSIYNDPEPCDLPFWLC